MAKPVDEDDGFAFARETATMTTNVKRAALIVLLLCLTGCVAGSLDAEHAANGGLLSQFFLGLWHGLISPLTLLVEVVHAIAPHLLPWSTHIYETRASGPAYDVGFYLGLAGSPIVVRSGWSRRTGR
jgi:hypothetical protein